MSVFAPAGPWLFGRTTDLLVFGGSALASLLLLGVGHALGLLHGDAPLWVWLACVVGIDVAHVWSTAFRVYFDKSELTRRPLVYFGIPAAAYVVGVMAYATSPAVFWRLLAYIAVYHFVRQQYGWVALYRRRARDTSRLDATIDTVAIYAATLYPVIYWHAHLPRRFHWFLEGDFARGLASSTADALAPVYWLALSAFAARQLWRIARGESVSAGKILVVASTAVCWYVGIVALDSDYAFTVTNVVIHGVPYLALTYRYARVRAGASPRSLLGALMRSRWVGFLAFVLIAAVLEEALWDRHVWHEHAMLFGGAGIPLEPETLALLVPLLALPQAVHYALDGFVWRLRDNPLLATELAPATAPAASR